MSSLIKNELIKLSKRKKILISIILMICFSAIIILISNVSENQTNTGYYKRVLESQKETLKEELKKTKDQAKKQKIEVQIKSIENQIILLDINKNKNWKDTVKEQINAFEERKKLALDISYEDSKEYYNSQIKKLKYLLEHNINPNDENKVNGSTLFVIFLQLMGGFFIPIIVIVIASDIISNEFSSKTIRLLASKPISKKNIVISKFIAATIVCLAVIVGIELLIYFIFGIIKGFGNLNFPLTVGTKYKIIANNAVPIYESSQIIPYITAIIVGILIQMLYIIASISLFTFISTLVKTNSSAVIFSLLFTIGLGIIIDITSQFNILSILQLLSIVKYADPFKLLANEISRVSKISFVTPQFSLIVLFLYLIVPLILSLKIFEKKDITV